MQKKLTISKSSYTSGLTCKKAFWFNYFRKDLKDDLDKGAQNRIESGNEVGNFAKLLYSNGAEVQADYWDIEGGERLTKELISKGQKTIFEATAIDPETKNHTRIDILSMNVKGNWDLVEVKGSTKVQDYHLDDLSFQYFIFTKAGYKIDNCYLLLINNKYKRSGDLEPEKFFIHEDVSEEIRKKQIAITAKIKELQSILKGEEPIQKIGPHCDEPFECLYKSHCWKGLPEYIIPHVLGKKGWQIAEQVGSFDVKAIPPELFPNGVKSIDILCYQNSKNNIEPENIKSFVLGIEYPVYYLDYETIMPVFPLFQGTRPYQQIPFQFSLHVEAEDGSLNHYEYLHREHSDPRPNFIKALIQACGKQGTVIVYNQGFEKSRNKELAEDFPGYSSELLAINDRVVDLMLPFRSRWAYSPKQMGSHSIKEVLPAFTELNYKDLKVSNGGQAMDAFLSFIKDANAKREDAFWQDLLKYCERDTFAMVRLMAWLRSIANRGSDNPCIEKDNI